MDFAAAFARLQARAPFRPELAIVLGSGLGALADCPEAAVGQTVSFAELGFPAPTVPGHQGRMLFCELEGRKVVLQAGRFHGYEGHPMALVTASMRLFGRLGVPAVVHTNAAGAIHPDFRVGQLMVLSDHINFMGGNPLVGPNCEPGPRFPDLSAAYDAGLRRRFHAAAESLGMSTVPEVIVARHEGMKVAALSCLCNMAAGMLPQALSHQEVLDAGAAAAGAFEALVRTFLRGLAGPERVGPTVLEV